ncbi:hypothetical protein [Hippea sp. KM1]|uniref:hypothetical protein n=1 Tax=Hippea sp. KM1 TaxID=944481 RepID=UPI00046C9759|nr:hypothetical protein [Hippea sp. KM1]
MANIEENIEFTDNGKKVIIPRELWDEIVEALEDYGLLKAMEEAENSSLLTKEEACEDYLLGRLAKERLKDLDKAVEVGLDELNKE